MNFRKIAIAGAVALAMSGAAQATNISFEGGADPLFSTIGVSYLNGATYYDPTSGYTAVALATGTQWVAFNPFEASPSSFLITGAPTATFTLNSFVIAGAWGSQTLSIEGYNDGVQLHSSSLAVSGASPITFSPGWAGIDELRISTGNDFVSAGLGGSGQHWALDSLTINEAVAAPVPEPETYAMMLAGLGMLGFMARRRKLTAAA